MIGVYLSTNSMMNCSMLHRRPTRVTSLPFKLDSERYLPLNQVVDESLGRRKAF